MIMAVAVWCHFPINSYVQQQIHWACLSKPSQLLTIADKRNDYYTEIALVML